jgi:hypothetical protein
MLAECGYVFRVDLRINRDYFPVEHLLIGFDVQENKADGASLLRAAN